MELTDYLNTRGIDLNPSKIEENPVLENEELLREVAGVWQEHQRAIKAVLQARVNALAIKILNGKGYENVILQQAMVEIAGVIIDFEKYSGELVRLNTSKEPKPLVGGKGSL